MMDILLFPLIYAILTLALATLLRGLKDYSLKLLMLFAVLISLGYTGFLVSFTPNILVEATTSTLPDGTTKTYYKIYMPNQDEFIRVILNYNYIMIGFFFAIAILIILKSLGKSIKELFRISEKLTKEQEYELKYS